MDIVNFCPPLSATLLSATLLSATPLSATPARTVPTVAGALSTDKPFGPAAAALGTAATHGADVERSHAMTAQLGQLGADRAGQGWAAYARSSSPPRTPPV